MDHTDARTCEPGTTLAHDVSDCSTSSPDSRPSTIDLMPTVERQKKLKEIQRAMQSLWNQIEYHKVRFGDTQKERENRSLANLWAKFREYERLERVYLRSGTPWEKVT
jgi:hypothetical protein